MSEEEKPLLFKLFDWIASWFEPKQPEQEDSPPEGEEPKVPDEIETKEPDPLEERPPPNGRDFPRNVRT